VLFRSPTIICLFVCLFVCLLSSAFPDWVCRSEKKKTSQKKWNQADEDLSILTVEAGNDKTRLLSHHDIGERKDRRCG